MVEQIDQRNRISLPGVSLMKTHIISDVNSLKVQVEGPATANIWLLINGREFPAIGWNDFVVVVLSWWARSLFVLIQNEMSLENVDFMEGAFAVEASRPSPSILRLRALAGPDRAQQTAIAETPILPFIRGLIGQSRDVLEACRLQNWWSSDAQSLENSLLSLERVISGNFPEH